MISDLWYQPKNKDEIIVMVETPSGRELSICDLEWKNHEKSSYEHIYNECLQIAREMGYELEGNC